MIKTLNNFILIEPIIQDIKRSRTTASGVLVAHEKDDRPDLVVASGKVVEASEHIFEPGQVVYYNYFSGNTLVIPGTDPLGSDDKEYHLVAYNDLLAFES